MTRPLIIGTVVFLIVSSGHAEISRNQAHQLAATYFVRYFDIGCGGVGIPVLRGNHWDAPLQLGFAGTFSGYIRVDARTGQVSSDRYPVASAASLEAYSAELKRRARQSKLKKHQKT